MAAVWAAGCDEGGAQPAAQAAPGNGPVDAAAESTTATDESSSRQRGLSGQAQSHLGKARESAQNTLDRARRQSEELAEQFDEQLSRNP
jgi:hypothetical protein